MGETWINYIQTGAGFLPPTVGHLVFGVAMCLSLNKLHSAYGSSRVQLDDPWAKESNMECRSNTLLKRLWNPPEVVGKPEGPCNDFVKHSNRKKKHVT